MLLLWLYKHRHGINQPCDCNLLRWPYFPDLKNTHFPPPFHCFSHKAFSFKSNIQKSAEKQFALSFRSRPQHGCSFSNLLSLDADLFSFPRFSTRVAYVKTSPPQLSAPQLNSPPLLGNFLHTSSPNFMQFGHLSPSALTTASFFLNLPQHSIPPSVPHKKATSLIRSFRKTPLDPFPLGLPLLFSPLVPLTLWTFYFSPLFPNRPSWFRVCWSSLSIKET